MAVAPMINNHIRNARERAGITLTEAAARLGIGKATLSRLESGQAPIASSRLPEFARVYRTSVADLIDNRVSERTPEHELREIAQVAEMVEEVVQGMSARPNPKVLGQTVAEVIRLARDDQVQRLDGHGQFDPARYRGIVAAYLGGGGDVRNP